LDNLAAQDYPHLDVIIFTGQTLRSGVSTRIHRQFGLCRKTVIQTVPGPAHSESFLRRLTYRYIYHPLRGCDKSKHMNLHSGLLSLVGYGQQNSGRPFQKCVATPSSSSGKAIKDHPGDRFRHQELRDGFLRNINSSAIPKRAGRPGLTENLAERLEHLVGARLLAGFGQAFRPVRFSTAWPNANQAREFA